MPSAKFLNKNLRFFEETIFFPSFSDIQRNFSYFLKDTFWLACQKCTTDVLRKILRKKIESKTSFFYKFCLLSDKWSANLSFFFGEDVKAPLYLFFWTIWRRRIFSGKSHSVITCVQWVMNFHPFVVIFPTDLSKLNFTFPKENHLKKISVLKKLLFFNCHFWTMNKTSSTFVETFLAASTDKRSTFPWEHSEEPNYIWKRIFFPTILGAWAKIIASSWWKELRPCFQNCIRGVQRKSLRKRLFKRIFFYHFSLFFLSFLAIEHKSVGHMDILAKTSFSGNFCYHFWIVSHKFLALRWIYFDSCVETDFLRVQGKFWGTLFPQIIYFFPQFSTSSGKLPVFFWETCGGSSYLVLDVHRKFWWTASILGKIYFSSHIWTLSGKISFPLLQKLRGVVKTAFYMSIIKFWKNRFFRKIISFFYHFPTFIKKRNIPTLWRKKRGWVSKTAFHVSVGSL